jgi:hypothetical protein
MIGFLTPERLLFKVCYIVFNAFQCKFSIHKFAIGVLPNGFSVRPNGVSIYFFVVFHSCGKAVTLHL